MSVEAITYAFDKVREDLAKLGLAPHEHTIRGGTIQWVWGLHYQGARPELDGAEISVSGVSGQFELYHNSIEYTIRNPDARFGR